MTRSTNMEHVWKVGDRVRALCGVGDYIRSGDVGTVAAIDCGGVLWCTWDNPVTPEFDEFGWCIRADEVAPADAAIAALPAPQPPAEAQERPAKPAECADGCPDQQVCDHCQWPPGPDAEAQPVANGVVQRHVVTKFSDGSTRVEDVLTAPSAPVGVEERAKAIAAEFCPRGDYSHGDVIEAIQFALAQQPAAAGEEIMVNASHDVYTLPLQPSGLSSGPRFVVHVPGPEQPAAPSGEASVIIDNYRRSATQPGGSDND